MRWDAMVGYARNFRPVANFEIENCIIAFPQNEFHRIGSPLYWWATIVVQAGY
jgi:hypothetical protein